MIRYILSYRKTHGWVTVYDGTNRGEAFSAWHAELLKKRAMVCFSEAPQ